MNYIQPLLSEWPTLISAILGGIITWIAARFYYVRAAKELRNETDELLRLNRVMLLGMEKAGWIQVFRDQKGNMTKYAVTYPSNVTSGSTKPKK
jgi:hypothetical protein